MKARNLAIVLAATAFWVHIAPVASAQSAPPSTASGSALNELIRTGIAAYRAKDYPAARAALLEAIKLSSDPLPIGILADTEMKLKRYRDAAEHWSIYLAALPADQSADRAEATAQLERCRAHVGLVLLDIQPSEARLLVDGKPVELAGGKGELWLEPGNYSLQARTDAGTSEPQSVVIKRGEKSTVTLVAPSPPVAVPQPAAAPIPVAPSATQFSLSTAPASPERQTSAKTVVLIGGSAMTIIAAGVGTAYWFMNSSAKSDSDTATRAIGAQTTDKGICASSNPLPACGQLQTANDKMKSTADISNVAFVAAGVLGVATIGTYLLWPNNKKSQQANLLVTPYWSPSNQGVTARVAF